jgi:hypothetical protein
MTTTAAPPDEREGRRHHQRDDEHIARPERCQEQRHEPAQERLVAPDVVDEVLG